MSMATMVRPPRHQHGVKRLVDGALAAALVREIMVRDGVVQAVDGMDPHLALAKQVDGEVRRLAGAARLQTAREIRRAHGVVVRMLVGRVRAGHPVDGTFRSVYWPLLVVYFCIVILS